MMAVLALLSATVLAQDTMRVFPVDTISVSVMRGETGLARVPAAISVIGRERIQSARAGITLDEALNEVPGLFVNNRYNYALGTRISVRGFGSRAAFGVRGIRLIQDGIPLTMPDGQSNLNNIDLTSIGRIEVLRGAASMLHGNAAGGVIALQTERPAAGFAMEMRGIAADYGNGGAGGFAKFNGKFSGGSAAWRYLVSGAHINNGGTRAHSRFEQTNVTARVLRGGTSFTLSLADAPVAENPGALPRDSFRLKPQMAWPRNVLVKAGEKSRQLQAGMQHAWTGARGAHALSIYGVSRTLDNPLPFAYITLDRKAGGIRHTTTLGAVTAGIDVELQNDRRAEFTNENGSKGTRRRDQTDLVASTGPFVRAVLNVSKRTAVSIGARYDYVRFEVNDHFIGDGRDDSGKRSMGAFSPAFGITRALTRRITAFANASTSFQTPTTTELINAPAPDGAPCCAPGLNALRPEHAVSFEAGARGRLHERLAFDAAIYRMKIRNTIVPYQMANGAGRNFFRNAGRTRHQGLEASAAVDVSRPVRLFVSYTYSDFIFENDGADTLAHEGNHLPGVAPHHVVLRAAIHARAVTIEPELEALSSYYANDANTRAALNNGVAIMNIRFDAKEILRTGLAPLGAINNVTGRRYSSSVVINAAGARYFEPAPGRNLFLGLRFRYPGKRLPQ